ncbi:MAG: T9SS type A sorting domain-containing protein [Bacteroidales bacterium]|nr:T9SS type A sorting domain-containing protein [Bacteroidales bacterium]
MKKLLITLIALYTLGLGNLFAQNWETLESGTSYILFDISFAKGQNDIGYAAGMQYTYDAEGVVIKTTDSGDNWTQIMGGAGTNGIEAVCFTTNETGFIAGWDYFAKTTNGGGSWTEISVGNDNWYFMDIEFWDEENGVALSVLNSGVAAIYVTSNGGDTWSTSFGINHNVQDLAYADANTLYAIGGDEKISKSTNGGNSWTEIYSGVFQYYFMGVDFNGDFGVVGGEDGKIMHTSDGGENWSTYATGYHNFQGVHVFNADSTYIGGTDADVYKTTDGGASWQSEDNGPESSHIYKIKATANNTTFLCGSQGMLKRKVAPPPLLTADFEADGLEICNWMSVYFTDLSEGNIESWEWYFEGGAPETSTEQNPMVFFTTPGTYDVSLTVSNGSQQASITKEDYITSYYCPGLPSIDMKQVFVSPNPVKNTINISGLNGEKAMIKLLDLSGKLILEKQIQGNQLDVSKIKSGVYLLNIEIDGIEKREKVIIE